MWWTLPTEIVESILELVSFHDYVALTQTSEVLRETLDTQRLFSVVAKSNYGPDLRAYNWPLPAHATKASLIHAFGRLNEFFNAIEKDQMGAHAWHERTGSNDSKIEHNTQSPPEFSGGDTWESLLPGDSTSTQSTYNSKKAERLNTELISHLQSFATDELYFVPVVAQLRAAKTQLSQALATLKDQSPHEYELHEVGILKLSWARKLFQLINFSHAVRFFRDRIPDEVSDIESCYYELARCSVEFESLAPQRSAFFQKLENQIVKVLPITSGGLQFRSEQDYTHLLKQVITSMMPHIAHAAAGSGGNILRIYEGHGQESLSLYLSIVAKALQEFVFDKISIRIGRTEYKDINICVTTMFLVVGELYISINFEHQTLNIYQKKHLQRIHGGPNRQVVSPMTCHGVIQRAFESNQTRGSATQHLTTRRWAEMQPQTSEEKSRFIRMILLAVNDQDALEYGQFCPLLKKNDFFLYYLFAETLLQSSEPTSDVSFGSSFSKFKSLSQAGEGDIQSGTLIVNHQSDYFGVILGHGPHRASETGSFYTAVPFDKAEVTIAHSSNVEMVAANNFECNLSEFLHWLLSTEGINYAGAFLFSRLEVEQGVIRFT